MADTFDPYLKWLAIPKQEQPPNHYRLLALPLYMDDADVIENAADQRMGHLRKFGSGKHSGASQRILNEIAAARICLLTPEKKSAYDSELRAELEPVRQVDETPRPAPAAIAVGTPPTVIDPIVIGAATPKSVFSSNDKPSWRQPVVAIAASAVLLAVIIAIVIFATRPTDVARDENLAERVKAKNTPSNPQARQAANAGNPTRPRVNDGENTNASDNAQDRLQIEGGGEITIAPEPPPKPQAAPSLVPSRPSLESRPATPRGEGKYVLELPGTHLLVVQGTANMTALDREFTAEAWVRWPEDAVNGMELMGNRPRQRDNDTQFGAWNLWYMAPTTKPQGKIALQYFLTQKKHHQMGARPTIDSARIWHHVVFSRSNERYWICLDGKVLLEEELVVDRSPHRAAHGDFYIGAHAAFWHSQGRGIQIAGVRLSEGVRYRQDFPPPRALVVDETSLAVLDFTRRLDGSVKDLSPNHHDGVFEKGQWIEFAP